jgi:hypothetical protein
MTAGDTSGQRLSREMMEAWGLMTRLGGLRWRTPFPPSKLSSKFQFFNPHWQVVDLIGFFSISS